MIIINMEEVAVNRLDQKIAEYNTKYKEEIGSRGVKSNEIPLIPFTSPLVNYMTHGGFPRGKIVEFFGLESSGKTTTAIDICYNAQKVFLREYQSSIQKLVDKNKKFPNAANNAELEASKEAGPQKVVYFDLEQTLDIKWLKQLGVDLNSIYLIRPDGQSAEQLLEMLMDLVSTGEVGLVVLDSVPALVSDAELGKTLDEQTMGGVAKLLGTFFRKILPLLKKFTCSLLVVNQLRESMSAYGDPYVTPGGKALKFYACLRLHFQKGNLLGKNGEEIKVSSEKAYGNIVQIRLKKSKIFPPDRLLTSYTLSYFEGIQYEDDLVILLLAESVIGQAGSFFTLSNGDGEPLLDEEGKVIKLQGKANLVKYIKDNKKISEFYTNLVYERFIK